MARRRSGAGLPVTQASGRTSRRLVGTAGARGWSLRAGRPDTFNVWHAVSPDKALRANNFTQMQSGGHA
ncbi:hypothetical protein GCM10010497_18380 [Streptomyces cinereoruber]|uniref:Uncharacterized protein n=1 Tax=Streptomyces cinereoruber TaxID=67260 RepID=A0AAV4KDX0_9ACTN|nr:hypothetical protein GCM10010497_18380 [Streptomyces cinereoruber]